jgi:hypothetical protein
MVLAASGRTADATADLERSIELFESQGEWSRR